MSKFKMPSVQHFLDKKTIYGPKKESVWVYLEKEMRAMDDKGTKPYNNIVGEWLRFLRGLKHYFYCEAKRKERQLLKAIGPRWYFELSTQQREVLAGLKQNIHQDIIENLPKRTRKALSDLGITLKIPRSVLLQAMTSSEEDPGIFIWYLYTALFKLSPSVLRPEYDINAMLLMSSLVFIDLDECIERLEKLTAWEKIPATAPNKKQKKYYEPKCPYGVYLQKQYAVCYVGHPEPKKPEPQPLGHKLRLRSAESYEKLVRQTGFLEKRKERNKKEIQSERVCTYPFWEPPGSLRNSNPEEAALANQLKMIKKKARPKFKSPYKNVQYLVTGIVFCKGNPHFCLGNVSVLQTGYTPINGGLVNVLGEYMTHIQGQWKYPREVKKGCDKECCCVQQWEETAMRYLKESKCKCGHLYDLKHEGKPIEKYFYPATRHGPFWIDKAKVFQFDPMEDFIKDCVKNALMSGEPSIAQSEPTLAPSGLREEDLLCAFLADLTDSPLLIPHLPQACKLNNLKEWVRMRVKGDINPKDHKKWLLQSQRRWQFLKHKDFRARAYRIPFTLKELEHMTWSHRKLVMTLFHILLDDFVLRNQIKQVEQTRLWWATTKYDPYPSKAFLDIFFTYMAPRTKDTFMINPYSSELTPKYGAKTCPL